MFKIIEDVRTKEYIICNDSPKDGLEASFIFKTDHFEAAEYVACALNLYALLNEKECNCEKNG